VTEEKLISSCAKGDKGAQRIFFDRYYDDLYRVVKRYMGNKQDTEDVTIEVFNKAYQHAHKFEFRGTGSVGKWLKTIAINASINALKKIKHTEELDVIADETTNPAPDLPIDIERVQQILASMPAGYRKVFNLFAIDEYTHSEISELLSISRNTSKSQMLKARKFIIQALTSISLHEK